MATNTPNLNLVKPEMSDYADIRVINGNMDIIDNAINEIKTGGTGLTYLKDVTTTGTGLTFTKNDESSVNVPLNYLPLTGGNATGDITVNTKTLVYVVEKLVDEANEKYKITAIKYSDGTLRQTVTGKIKSDDSYTPVTFLVPFTSVDDITLNSGAKLPATDTYKNPHYGWFRSVSNLSTTGATFQFTNDYMYWDFTFTGYWK